MHGIPRSLHGEDFAAHFGIAGHGLIVDVITQRLRDRGDFLRHLLHIVGKAGVAAKVAILQRFAGLLKVVVAMVEQGRAQCAMLGDETGQCVYGVEARIFTDPNPAESGAAMIRPLLLTRRK
jgi:hypothetical protein